MTPATLDPTRESPVDRTIFLKRSPNPEVGRSAFWFSSGMPLDVHKVRQLCRDAQRESDNAKRDVERILSNFRSLGSGFTGDRLYSSEYSKLDQATKDAVRAMDKIRDAVRDIERKA